MQATRSSKYSLAPLNEKCVRTGRAKRVLGGGRWLAGSGQDRGDSNPSERSSSLVNVDMAATIPSGEMYPEWGILK